MPVYRPCATSPLLLGRPLLHIRRQELESYAHARGINWREDSSNRSREFTRNRMRHDILPMLRQEWRDFDRQILRLNAISQRLWRIINTWLEKFSAAGIWWFEDEKAFIDLEQYRQLPLVIRPEILRRITRQLAERTGNNNTSVAVQSPLEAKHITGIASFLAEENHGSRSLDLPEGLTLQREYDAVYFTYPHSENHKDLLLDHEWKINSPDELPFHFADWLLAGKVLAADEEPLFSTSPASEHFNLDRISWPLTIRHQREGDRFHPLGAPGACY